LGWRVQPHPPRRATNNPEKLIHLNLHASGAEISVQHSEERWFSTQLAGASEEEVASLADAYQTSGKEGYWRWRLDYNTERAKQEYVSRISFAEIYAHLGDKDRAFEQLEKAFEQNDNVTSLKEDPRWYPLRDDPRFQGGG
jgi:Tfp pilus assembly protein PilF